MNVSLRSSGPSPVPVGFMMDQVALGQVFLRVRHFPLSVSFYKRSTHLHLRVAFVIRTNGRSLGTFPKALFFPGSIKKENCLPVV
jgi:hypothetical protein